jgi:hypothetical protein
MMKKLCGATIIGLWLLISFGCSSTPPGTISVKDLVKNSATQVGQHVVVVGMSEIQTSNAPPRMFRVFKSSDYLWVELPEDASEPPEGVDIRISGTLQQKEFPLLGKVYYIQADKVSLE